MSNNKYFQWYIATTIIGSEESIFNSLMDKIKAYDFDDHISGMKIINYKDIQVEYFDENNPAPRSMKNSKYINWYVLDDGRYKKVTTKIYNKFPGYIFINMIMTDEIWYIIRNTPGITGFIGSSGKGAKPIPISEDEIEVLFSQENEEIVTYINDKPGDKNKPIVPEAIKKTINAQSDDFFDTKNSNVQENDVVQEDNTLEQSKDNQNTIQNNNLNLINEFKVGHSVELLTGAFIGEMGVIKNINEEEKTIEIEIDLFGRSNLVKVSANEVKKID